MLGSFLPAELQLWCEEGPVEAAPTAARPGTARPVADEAGALSGR